MPLIARGKVMLSFFADMFNDFEFDGKARVLALKCSLAIKQIKCSVEHLQVELDQLI